MNIVTGIEEFIVKALLVTILAIVLSTVKYIIQDWKVEPHIVKVLLENVVSVSRHHWIEQSCMSDNLETVYEHPERQKWSSWAKSHNH